MWDKRYAEKGYAYGIEPNQFFEESLKEYNPKGDILMVAEGEGRNAVYAAQCGLNVTAFDISHEGKKKAMKLAHENGVSIDYEVGFIHDLTVLDKSYDAAAFIFAHLPIAVRSDYHKKIAEVIRPNGIIILEGFSQGHKVYQELNPEVGGPKKLEMLYTKELIATDFRAFEALYLKEEVVELKEGKYHNGLAKVIRFVGRKDNNV